MSSQSHHITPLLFSKLMTCNYYGTISSILKFHYKQFEIDRCRIERNILRRDLEGRYGRAMIHGLHE